MLWIVLALMTGAAVLCVVWPLSKPRTGAMTATGDVGFYKAQLRAVDQEVEAGLVPAGEAGSTRAEVARRLMAAHDRLNGPQPASARPSRIRLFTIALAVMIVMPAVSLGLYLRTGQPEQGDLPLASRQTAPKSDEIGEAIARVEDHLVSHPDDGRGFEVLAPLYLRLGRYQDSARAYERALVLLGESATRRTGYGQALMMAADGVVTADARRAFEQASVDDAGAPQPRFYLGLAASQDGDKTGARRIWGELASRAPADAPWLPLVEARLSALDGTQAGPPTEGPDSPAGAAVAALPPDQRSAMIRGMVDGLAARLAHDGHDKAGWLKLIRAYAVLGDKDQAAKALADARRVLTDTQAVADLAGLARELGLES